MAGMKVLLKTVAAASLVVLGSCESATAPQAELARQRRVWADAEPVAYAFEMQRYCFCTPQATAAVIVEVQDGQVFRRTYRDTGEELSGGPQSLFPTVDGVFDLIEEMLSQRPHRIEVEYDAERGFPTSISYDGDAGISDDELSIVIRQFRLGDPG
jgi:hypothetical protein